MKDSTKKRLIIAGLVAVSVLLIFGISRVLYKEPVQELPKESKPIEEVEFMVDSEESGDEEGTPGASPRGFIKRKEASLLLAGLPP